jgi:hypothetical protein
MTHPLEQRDRVERPTARRNTMRLLLSLSLVLLPLTAFAQEGDDAPAPEGAKPVEHTLRVSLETTSTVDGEPVKQNTGQALAYGDLHKFGLRVDSKSETNTPGFDKWIAAQTKKWSKREPAAPVASLAIVVRQEANYNTAEFMGQPQAHIFKGGLNVEIKRADGTTVAEFGYKFQFGKSIRKKHKDGSVEDVSKDKIQQKFDEFVQKGAILGLLCNETIRAGVPEKKVAALDKYLKDTRDYLLKKLDGSTDAVKNGELATFLRSLKIETK